jgi:gentisate 1,2-dioxygenase
VEGHNLQVALGQIHTDVVRNNMAPYWVVDQSANHDEDRHVMQGRKAVPFIWKYRDQIEPLLQRSAELITTGGRVSKDIHPIGKKNPNLPFHPADGRGRL